MKIYRNNEPQISIKNEDIVKMNVILKETLPINFKGRKHVDEKSSDKSIADFAKKLREVAKHFESFKFSNKNDNSFLSPPQKLPSLHQSLTKAMQNVQKEAEAWSDFTALLARGSVPDNATLMLTKLKEQYQQRLKVYRLHCVMANSVQDIYPDLQIMDSSEVLASKSTNELEDSTRQIEVNHLGSNQYKQDALKPNYNKFVNVRQYDISKEESSVNEASNSVDREIESILHCSENLLDKTWVSYSDNNKKERLKRITDLITPCNFK